MPPAPRPPSRPAATAAAGAISAPPVPPANPSQVIDAGGGQGDQSDQPAAAASQGVGAQAAGQGDAAAGDKADQVQLPPRDDRAAREAAEREARLSAREAEIAEREAQLDRMAAAREERDAEEARFREARIEIPSLDEVLARGYKRKQALRIIEEQVARAIAYRDQLLGKPAPIDPVTHKGQWRVVATKQVSLAGHITTVNAGDVLDPRSYNIAGLRLQGVQLEPIPADED